ncbi:GTPase activator [Micromonospora sp. R77]|uniref:GTPase activator n=1 Tax=Micromonospora sp. R77 TaxID=2925836 RepID=UPI001F60288B|nr:GTPase activator [Micromonospora sp. R77]MCI4065182.1 GTPase activator [Micromonospora sp. R77]
MPRRSDEGERMSEREKRDDATADHRDPAETRDAEEAHGGSMAPGLVDDTGHPVEPSALGAPGEDGTGS